MSSLLGGTPGLLIGYLNVTVPMIVAMTRYKAEQRKLAMAPIYGIPLTVAAGFGNLIASPFLHGLGISAGSFLELAAGIGLAGAIGYGAGRRFARSEASSTVHQRGTVVRETLVSQVTDRRTNPTSENATADSATSDHATSLPAITLAGLPVASLDETKHFKLVGTTGTGKSTAIRELLHTALERGDRAIIADPDGGYLEHFGNERRGDVILNPFDPRSRRWDLFGEIENGYDVDQLARSLLPDPGGSADRTWIEYARTFFVAVTRQAHEGGVKDIEELYRLLVIADASELREFLKGTPAQPFLKQDNARMFESIHSVTSSAVRSLDYVAQQEKGEPLAVRQWVRDRQSGGVLFIPYRATQIAAMRSTVSAWMRLAIFEAMSQPEGDQRLWFVVDELDALGAIDGLKDALARLRKFGGRVVLGFQSVAQVSNTYGQAEARTIVENCGNSLILRCSGSDSGGTANFASRLIGQRQVLRSNTSRSRRPMSILASTTVSEHVGIEPAVMDSQIEQLPDLTGYLKFASVPSWQRVSLVRGARPEGMAEQAEDSLELQVRSVAKAVWNQWRATMRADQGEPQQAEPRQPQQAQPRQPQQPQSAQQPPRAAPQEHSHAAANSSADRDFGHEL